MTKVENKVSSRARVAFLVNVDGCMMTLNLMLVGESRDFNGFMEDQQIVESVDDNGNNVLHY